MRSIVHSQQAIAEAVLRARLDDRESAGRALGEKRVMTTLDEVRTR